MLKSTYKPAATLPTLPNGWTQHKAPNGTPYYYNNTTKQSTYVRPVQQALQSPQAPNGFPLGAPEQHNFTSTAYNQSNIDGNGLPFGPVGHHPFGQSAQHQTRGWGRGGNAYQSRPQPKDRPKRKVPIPNCSPWLLVQTKLGRRFVHNPEKGESFWKFPPDVMKAVVEYDRLEREKRLRKERGESDDLEDTEQAAVHAETARAESTDASGVPIAAMAPTPPTYKPTAEKMVDSDGEEYEEVEVTDDEEDDHISKRQKTEEDDAHEQPVEFNEDDIAYQLTAMGDDYGLDPGEYGDYDDEELEEGAEGLPLTEEDSKSLFKDMLSDNNISPYIPWDKLIEAGHIIEDDRYTVLPNMKARKDVWDEWSRDTIQQVREQRAREEKKDPRIPYFAFLQSHATPKLYWPEFRRKYKKEPEIHSTKLSDKDREKWYREHINRLKLPESTLKRDLVQLLNSTPLHDMKRSTTIVTLPVSMLTDLRYISLRSTVRDPLIEAHIASLPAAPTDLTANEADIKSQSDRQRREQALAARQKQVLEEKRRQNGALQHSRGMLREGEEELKQALVVGKQASDEPDSISFGSIQTHLQSYPSYIPPKLRGLDEQRFVTIPEAVAQREREGNAFLEKSEVSSLVEWKLKHGTFRPNLFNLVASNPGADILSTTKAAFAIYEADNTSYAVSIKILTRLKGVGPATASLLLSCYDPVEIPFLSDDLFRYALWERKTGYGWDRKIKYSMKEYDKMYEKVRVLVVRLDTEGGEVVSALDLEKVAYVLGKEAERAKGYDVDDDGEEEGREGEAKASEGGKKRKATSTGSKKSAETKNEPAAKKTRRTKKAKGTIESD